MAVVPCAAATSPRGGSPHLGADVRARPSLSQAARAGARRPSVLGCSGAALVLAASAPTALQSARSRRGDAHGRRARRRGVWRAIPQEGPSSDAEMAGLLLAQVAAATAGLDSGLLLAEAVPREASDSETFFRDLLGVPVEEALAPAVEAVAPAAESASSSGKFVADSLTEKMVEDALIAEKTDASSLTNAEEQNLRETLENGKKLVDALSMESSSALPTDRGGKPEPPSLTPPLSQSEMAQENTPSVNTLRSYLMMTAYTLQKSDASFSPDLVRLLDTFVEIRVDNVTEDEYWVMDRVPCVDQLRVLRRRRSFEEIVVGGLSAGLVVEFLAAFLYHPFDTLKTRLQVQPDQRVNKPFDRLFDGFAPVALTVPLLSVFWAVRDSARKFLTSALSSVSLPSFLPSLPSIPFGGTIILTVASVLGESVYWLVKTPGQVIKTRQQIELTEEQLEKTGEEPSEAIKEDLARQRENQDDLLQASLAAWPVLALCDVPYIGARTMFFSVIEKSDVFGSGVGEAALQFTCANILAVLLTTPLDVVRTRMLLQRSSIVEFPEVAASVYKEGGAEALFAGWQPRLLWNGIIFGATWGLVRQVYNDVRATFLVNILDTMEETNYSAILTDLLTSLKLLGNPDDFSPWKDLASIISS